MKAKKIKCDANPDDSLVIEKRGKRDASARITFEGGASRCVILGEFKLRYLKQAIETALMEIHKEQQRKEQAKKDHRKKLSNHGINYK
jgi:hypothetical protein